MAVDSAMELLFLDTFKHPSAEVRLRDVIPTLFFDLGTLTKKKKKSLGVPRLFLVPIAALIHRTLSSQPGCGRRVCGGWRELPHPLLISLSCLRPRVVFG